MNFYLRQRSTGLYYGGEQGWVSTFMRACGYTDVDRAIEAARQARLPDASVVIRFDPGTFEVAVPVTRLRAQK
jgi:hypothetical protein